MDRGTERGRAIRTRGELTAHGPAMSDGTLIFLTGILNKVPSFFRGSVEIFGFMWVNTKSLRKV